MAFFPHLLLALLEGTVAAAVLALSALGLSLVFGVMRVVNVAHGEFFMLGAMLAWWVAKLVPGGPLAGFLAALVVAPLAVGFLAFGEALHPAQAVACAMVLGAILLTPAKQPRSVAAEREG